MKKLAAQAKLAARYRRRRQKERESDPVTQIERLAQELDIDVPDTWEPKFRPENEQKARSRNEAAKKEAEAAQKEAEEAVRPSAGSIKAKRRRRNTLSYTVSDEEEAMIRDYLKGNAQTLSAFTRHAVFAYMGTNIPER